MIFSTTKQLYRSLHALFPKVTPAIMKAAHSSFASHFLTILLSGNYAVLLIENLMHVPDPFVMEVHSTQVFHWKKTRVKNIHYIIGQVGLINSRFRYTSHNLF